MTCGPSGPIVIWIVSSPCQGGLETLYTYRLKSHAQSVIHIVPAFSVENNFVNLFLEVEMNLKVIHIHGIHCCKGINVN